MSSTGPRFSVIVPVYRSNLRLLDDVLRSIAGQTEPDFECHLVDDGSNDPVLHGVLRGWVDRDDRFRLTTLAENRGIAAATNVALDEARGEWVVFCDHDDILLDRALAVLATSLQSVDADLIYSDAVLIDEDGLPLAMYRKPSFSRHRLLGQNYISHLCAVRRAMLDADRLRSEFEPCQDSELVLRLVDRGARVLHVPEPLYRWRAIAGSVALDVNEKPHLARAVQRAAQESAARRGRSVVAQRSGSDDCCLLFDEPPREVSVEVITFTDGDLSGLASALSATSAEVVMVADPRHRAPTPEDAQAVGADALVDGVGLVGPHLVSPSGDVLVSAGREGWPYLADVGAGAAVAHPGEWGAFQVAREVSCVALHGLTARRELLVELLGDVDSRATLSADALAVAVCDGSLARGLAVLSTPKRRLTADVRVGLDRLLAGRRPPDPFRLGGVVPLLAAREPAGGSRYAVVAQMIDSGSIDLLTTDVFDTLVWRDVAEPAHLFSRLATSLRERGLLRDGVSDELFVRARRVAERRAREQRGGVAPEVTLDEIWALIPDRLLADGARRSRCRAAELDVEAENLRVHRPAVELLVRAAHHGVVVVAVSDIYLSSLELHDVLARCGVPTTVFERIVTSADRGVGKAGGLLAAVIRESGVSPQRTLHIGDNRVSDVEAAERAGARAVSLAVDGGEWIGRAALASADDFGDLGSDLGIGGLLRERALAEPSRTDAFALGALGLGPVLCGFASWVADRADAAGAETVHFLLREGRFIAELVEAMRPAAVDARFVHASRWAVMRAAVTTGSLFELQQALGRRDRLTVAHIVAAFDLDRAAVERATAAVAPTDGNWAMIRAIADDPDLVATIVERSAALRSTAWAYLKGALRLDGSPVVLCDIGWGGTIQHGLEIILRAEGVDVDVHGLYLSLSQPGLDRQAQGLSMEGYLTVPGDRSWEWAAVTHNPEAFEQICTPHEATTVGYEPDGTPVLASRLSPTPPDSLLDARRGVLAAAATMGAAAPHGDARWSSLAARRALLRRSAAVLATPDRIAAETIGGWLHDDVAGDDPTPIVPGDVAAVLPYVSASDALRMQASDVHWIAGAAALHAPGLLGVVNATQRGVPADTLERPNPLGIARLAVFCVGDDDAALLDERRADLSPIGGVALRVSGAVGAVRTIRFDPGAGEGLVLVDRLEYTVTTVDGRASSHGCSLTDGGVRLVDATPLGPGLLLVHGAAEVLVDVPDDIGGAARHVAAVCTFRVWDLAAGEIAARLPGWVARSALRRGARGVGRVARAVSRRPGDR